MTAFEPAIPILRIFDERKAREFYVDFLGFDWEWEHRFDDNAPLYAQVALGELRLHLSEHHGDGTPGTRLFIPTSGLDDLHTRLIGANYRYNRPGIEHDPWGRTVTVTDPFSNHLSFCEWNR